jgi:formylglycine-generating enzyme required for sulfatase activity
MNKENEVFISYTWGGESEAFVNKLHKVLVDKGFNVLLDKVDIQFKGNIKEFMQRLGSGKAIIVVISDKYLQSHNCMYEIVEIKKKGDFIKRIFPIIFSDADICEPKQRLRYITYWEKQVKSLNAEILNAEDVSLAHTEEIQKDLLEYNEILNTISHIMNVLRNTKFLTPEILEQSEFRELIESLPSDDFEFDVYLSCSELNKVSVLPLVTTMQDYGLRVFISFESIAGNVIKSLSKKRNKQLENSRHFVLFCTPEAIQSANIKNEYQFFCTKIHQINKDRKCCVYEGPGFSEDLMREIVRTNDRATDATSLVERLLDYKEHVPPAKRKWWNKINKIVVICILLFILALGIGGFILFAFPKPVIPVQYTPIPIPPKPPAPKLQPVITEKMNGVKIRLVRIPGGTFQMGSDERDNETPIHTVHIRSFYMGQYEITQKQWRAVMGDDNNPSKNKGDNLPVENVSWNDAQNFIDKLNQITGKNYRLPTEAEWEYAARGRTNTPFSTGICLSTAEANYDGSHPYRSCAKGNYLGKTTAVGQFDPNQYQLYEMHGNVKEWCNDWYEKEYYKSSVRNNPEGPLSGSFRVFRGGSWLYYAVNCRVTHRDSYNPDDRGIDLGFRIAHDQEFKVAIQAMP